MSLSPAQRNAVAHVRSRAERARPGACARVAAILERHGVAPSALERIAARVREHARVTLNFHPDRLRADGVTVAEGLLREGVYRSQFETGVTNGSPTAFPGGDRDRWERELFGGAYHEPAGRPDQRPKYGGLDLLHHADGASPRFGSSHLRLAAHVTPRCTLTWGDSHLGPEHVGTIDAFEPVLAALLDAVDTTRAALGVADVDVPRMLDLLDAGLQRGIGRALDEYVEAQVHGAVELATDVEAIVMDPAFDGTPTGARLEEIASRHGVALERHAGFVLHAREVPDDFRGPLMVPLAARVAAEFADRGDVLDAAVLGRAAASIHRTPEAWKDWAAPAESWQHVKQLWHVLVRFGHARDELVHGHT